MHKEENEFKDDFIKSIAKNAERKKLPEHFENNLMDAIRLRNEFKNEIASKLRKSLYYFLTAIALVLTFTIATVIGKSSIDSTISLLPIITLFISVTISIIIISNYNRLLHKSIV
ncbi:MAG: hypothetical protein AAFZ89_05825 [Bacteroidota bacterium]